MLDTLLFQNFEAKAASEAEAYELGTSTFRIMNNGKVLPYAVDDGKAVLERLSGLITSVGSKVLNRKLDGVMGSIVVTGSDRAKTIIDSEYDLHELTEKLARDMIAKGSAGLGIGIDSNGTPYVYRLGGFITRVTAEYDVDRTIAILQAQQSYRLRWQVKLFSGGLVQEWDNLLALTEMLRASPTREYQNALNSIAFFADYQIDDSGFSIGEVEQLSPILKGIMAVEARIHRVSEIFGFPRAVISGAIQESENAPDSAIIVSQGGSVEYLTPADMKNLIDQKADLLMQLDDMAIMPAGQELGKERQSGTAIQEANQAFNNNIERYAINLSRILTQAFAVYFQTRGVTAGSDFAIKLTPNKVEDESQKLADAIDRLDKGLLPISYVVKLMRSVYPDMTDAEAEEVVNNWTLRKAVITPQDLGVTSG